VSTAKGNGVLASYLPVPVNVAVCGLLPALSLTLSVPVLVPFAVGLNTTLMVHLPLEAKLVPQVVVDTAKSPEGEMTMLLSVAVRLLVNVNTLAALVVPTVWLAYVALVGVSVTGVVPVPVKVAICGEFAAESEMLSVALSAAMTVGANVTVMVHFWPAARDEPQVFV